MQWSGKEELARKMALHTTPLWRTKFHDIDVPSVSTAPAENADHVIERIVSMHFF